MATPSGEVPSIAGLNAPYFTPRIEPGSDRIARSRPFHSDSAQRSLIEFSPGIAGGRILVGASAEEELTELGGRVACPVLTTSRDKCSYREILTYWQSEPRDFGQNILVLQLFRWEEFRSHQDRYRDGQNFTNYCSRVSHLLKESGVDLSSYLPECEAKVLLNPQKDAQRELATWIEYFCFEYDRHSSVRNETWAASDTWNRAWRRLCSETDLLRESEHLPAEALALGRLESRHVVLEMERHRQALADFEILHTMKGSRRSNGRITALQDYEHWYREAKNKVDEISRRNHFIARFLRNTAQFCQVLAAMQRQDLLFQWILDQLPEIAAREGMDDVNRLCAPSWEPSSSVMLEALELPAPESFVTQTDHNTEYVRMPNFSCHNSPFPYNRLPREIQRHIWMHCLPPAPSAHFFQVVNHSRLPPLQDRWVSHEFRLKATSMYPSGYKTVYPLVASCRDARHWIWEHYTSLRDGSESRVGPINFQTFDWIPVEDLVVLCFPPKQGELPENDAITISLGTRTQARHIGVLLSREIMLGCMYGVNPDLYCDPMAAPDDAQVNKINEFMEALLCGEMDADVDAELSPTENGPELVGGGVAWMYFIVDGLKGSTPASTKRQITSNLEWPRGLDRERSNPVEWCFDTPRTRRPRGEPEVASELAGWSTVPHLDWPMQRTADEGGNRTTKTQDARQDGTDKRHVWWLNSESTCLALFEPGDMVQRDICDAMLALQRDMRDIGNPEHVVHGRETLGFISDASGYSIKDG